MSDLELREMTADDKNIIAELYKAVFTNPPWNDDWSDDEQLQMYIADLTGNRNSLSLGLMNGNELIGASLGAVKHWFSGTEYCIEELFIKTELQGRGIGGSFLEMIGERLREKGIYRIFLQTDIDMPAYSFYKNRGFAELEKHVSFMKSLR